MSISASSCFSIVVASSINISCFVVFWKFEITVANNANLLKVNYTTSEIKHHYCSKILKFCSFWKLVLLVWSKYGLGLSCCPPRLPRSRLLYWSKTISRNEANKKYNLLDLCSAAMDLFLFELVYCACSSIHFIQKPRRGSSPRPRRSCWWSYPSWTPAPPPAPARTGPASPSPSWASTSSLSSSPTSLSSLYLDVISKYSLPGSWA